MTKFSTYALMTLGIGGFISSVPLGIKLSKKMDNNTKQKKESLNKEKLSFKEYFQANWKELALLGGTLALSATCVILPTVSAQKQLTALSATTAASQTALELYKTKVKEVLGDKDAKKVDKAITEEKVKALETPSKIICKDDECLFYDSITGQIFKSTYDKIKSECNRLNAEAIAGSTIDGVITVNDWLLAIGANYAGTDNEYRGWQLQSGPNDLIVLDDFTSTITKSGDAVIVINYRTDPKDVNL